MRRSRSVLIVGGYGTFGDRLARLLSDQDGLTLLIAARSLERAQEFCSRELSACRVRPAGPDRPGSSCGARLEPMLFDRDGELARQLRAAKPDIVVDASGPFQSYGERPYRLVEACIECGIDYLDLRISPRCRFRPHSWDLIAEGDDGPFIPSMAAAALIRRSLAGTHPAAGARPAVRELELTDYEPLLARRAIHFGVREDGFTSQVRTQARVAERL